MRPKSLVKNNQEYIGIISVLLLTVFSILWRGGKSLEPTWLLVGVAWVCTFVFWKTNLKKVRSVPIWLWCLVLGFIGLTVLSFLQSTTQNYGLDEVFRTGSLGILLLWMGRTFVTELTNKQKCTSADVLLLFIGYTTIVACIIGVSIYIFQPVNRFVGTFFDWRFHTDYWPNAWGEYLLLAWPTVVFWLERQYGLKDKKPNIKSQFISSISFVIRNFVQNNKSKSMLQSLVLGFVFGCFFLSYSRGSFIALVGQLLLWAVILYFRNTPWSVWKKIMIRLIGTVAVSLVVFTCVNKVRSQYYEVESLKAKVTFSAAEGTSSAVERSQFWHQAIELTKQRPLLGWGPYSFRFVQTRMQTSVLATSDHPHNVVLKFSSERGVLTAILFLLIVSIIMYRSFLSIISVDFSQSRLKRIVFFQNDNSVLKHSFVLQVCFISIAGVLAHNLIDYNLQFIGIALPLWLFLGILSSVLYQKGTDVNHYKFMFAVELVLTTGLLIFAITEAQALVTSSIARHAHAKGELEKAAYWYDVSGHQIFSRDLLLARANVAFEEHDIDTAKLALKKYLRNNKQDSRVWKMMGDACRMQGDLLCALESYRGAYHLNKYNDLSITRWYVQTLLDLGLREEIDKKKYEFDSLLNEYQLAILENKHFIALSYNPHELIELVDTFAKLYPDQEPMYIVLGAKIDHKIQIEREKITARPAGYLW